MRAFQAHVEARDSFEQALLDAGLKKGVSLTPEQLKNESIPIFWYLNLTSKEASEKETYLSYEVADNKRIVYGDGQAICRKITIDSQVFTRKSNLDSLILAIEDKVLAKGWSFEIKDINYDPGTKLYSYYFRSQAEAY